MRGAATADPRPERVLLALLCLATALVWALQFHPFEVPNNDYPSFENSAEAFARGELPRSFQRMPILPGLMALLAPAMPGPHPLLQAALVLNLLFSLALLVTLHALAERTIGRGAILLPVLVAGTNQFHSMGLQPLVEPSLGFFCALAILLCARRSPLQYAAAGAAALSRYEAALLLGVLGLVNWVAERRFLRHFLLALAAGTPFALWLLGGVLRGSGASWYADEIGAMGFQPAPHFLLTALREPLRGWLDLGFAGALVGAALPIAVGLARGARRAPRETAALVLAWLLVTGTIVIFGVDKGRYAYAVQWVPLYFLSAGLAAPLGAAGRARIAATPRALLVGAMAVGAAALVAVLVLGVRQLAGWPPGTTRTLDTAWLATALVLLAIGLLRDRRSGALGALAASLPALVVAIPLLFSGQAIKAGQQYKLRFGGRDLVLGAAWLDAHLGPDERALVMHKKHYRYLSDAPKERYVTFSELDAEEPAALAAELRGLGVSYLVVTGHKPPERRQKIDELYERKYKWYLLAPFEGGGPVPGFVHVASLPLPEHTGLPPVQIYRVAAPGDGG